MYVTKTVDDPLFGPLRYIISDVNSECKFDKNTIACTIPLTDMDVQLDGEVFTCCRDWNPCSIGNTDVDDLKTIWNGERANALRNSILDGSYKYCNAHTCPAMISGKHHRLVPMEDAKKMSLALPRSIGLTIDKSCNLVCPSCRREKIIEQTPEAEARARRILQLVMDFAFSEPHKNPINLTMDGCGEVFFSAIYREFFETARIFKTPELWPRLTIVLCTNGVMMTEKVQKKYDILFNLTRYLRVSIDAGNQESYDKVRAGGDWDLLWKNLDYWYSVNKTRSKWTWNIVLQRDNFESLPDLIRLANNYPENLPEIYIVNLLDWGIGTPEEFEKKAVWSPKSPNHQRLREILNSPEVRDYPGMYQHSIK